MKYAGFIYEWTNMKTGSKYLGSHKGTVDDGYIGSGKAFLKALKRHGVSSFTREILEFVEHETDIFKREQYYLDERQCATSRKYYNISPTAGGGDSGAGDKISKTNKLLFATGKRVARKGIPLSKEQKEKLCDEWLVVFPDGQEIIIKNMLEFCKQHNLNPSRMSSIARGEKAGHHKGYKCKKLTNNRNVKYEYKEYRYKSDEEKKKINSDAVKKAKELNATPKIEYDGIVYTSLIKAIEATGLSRYLLIKNGKLLRNN
jgi:hypothetical protein